MPLPFSLPQRPSLPSLSWSTATSPRTDDKDSSGNTTPQSAPPRTSHSSSNTTSSISKRLSAKSIRHNSLVVSRPTTPAKASPLSATFGLPIGEDDDPFGVLALEKAGLQIKEAGTKESHRPGSDAFSYRPSPNSPVWRSSMASAVSKNSRPSLDGRASVVTSRPSLAHSRQSSVSDMATQTMDEGHSADGSSLRGMSPVRELSSSRRSSPESARKISPGPAAKRGKVGEKPPPLKLKKTVERATPDDPSPKTRFSTVQERIRQIEIEQKARENKAKLDKENEESDLGKLAREIRAMAQEHDDEHDKSEGASIRSEVLETVSEETQTETSHSDGVGNDAIPENSASKHASQKSAIDVNRTPKRRSRADIPPVGGDNESAKPDEYHEEDEDDDDDEDYDSFDDEEPVIIEQAVQTPVAMSFRPRNLAPQSLQARAQVVSIHMPPPPKIPSRNPRRARESKLLSDGESISASPDVTVDESKTSLANVESTQSSTESKAESVASSRDNDSNSSYSLEQERDSIVDAGHDLMSQTSHGSDMNEIRETTPTKSNSSSPSFEQSTKKATSESTLDRLDEPLQDSIVAASAEHGKPVADALATSSVHESPRVTQEQSTSSTELSDNPALPPAVPERRRPFSFEAVSSEDIVNQPAIDTVLGTSKDTLKETDDSATPTATTQPIVIPDLPDDDKSEYEEDFS